MIRVSDACLLAYTKLRARKVRLIVTVVISSLLFGVLALSSFVVRGMVSSANSFAEEGFGKRYILGADVFGGESAFNEDKSVLDRAIALQKDEIARKKAEAKRLGIEYDPASERLVYYEGEGPKGKGKYLDINHPLSIQASLEYLKKKPKSGLPELKKLGDPYGAIGTYESRYLSFGDPSAAGELKILKKGKEDFKNNNGQPGNPFGTGLDSFNGNWSLMSGELLKAFTLDNKNNLNTPDGVIPVIAPYSAVEQLLDLKPVPASSPAKARLARLQEVRSKAGTLEFAVCYRNETSNGLINQTIGQKAEIEQNKNTKDYQKPSLIYDLPAEPCGAVRITKDARTAEEKTLANKQEQFRRIFGEKAPEQTTLKFKIIGVAPDPPGAATAFVDGLISSIVSSNIGAGWFTPLEYTQRSPLVARLFPTQQLNGRPPTYYAELPTAEAARKMFNEASCQPDFMSFSGPPTESNQVIQDPFAKCAADGKPFSLMPFGSSSLALDELQKGFNKVFRIAALVVVVIAALIMMGTLGRIIADARRETAVFRAIGAKRLDIAQIYITYAIAVSLLIVIVSIAIGFLLAQIAQSRFGPRFTVNALLAYNARDITRQFYVYAWSSRDMLLIAASALGAGVISTIIPLLRNLRRNPIRDMRDEN